MTKQQQKAGSFWVKNWQAAILLFALPFLVYLSTYSFGFVLDDKIVFSENNFVKEGINGIARIFSTESFSGYLGGQQNLVVGARYRPLSIATFAIEYELWGFKPGLSHLINVFLYAITGLLCFRVYRQLRPDFKKQAWYLGIAFWASLLFLAHPIHTEAVANIKGRDEILCTLLSIGALFYGLQYAKTKRWLQLILMGLLFFMGILAKENAITFLAIIPLSQWLFTKTKPKELLASAGLLLLLTIIYLILRYQVIGYLLNTDLEINTIMNDPFLGMTIGQKYATILYTLGKYLGLLFFPHPLTHDYYPYHIPVMDWGDWQVWGSGLLYLGLIVAMVIFFKKRKLISWSVAYFIISLSIVSNLLFPVGSFMNERFIFLSSFSFCLILAYLILYQLPKLLPGTSFFNKVPLIIISIILLAYSAKTISRVPVWENEDSLNLAAIKVSKNSTRANSFYAYSLYQKALKTKDRTEKKQLLDEAWPYVNKALAIYPTYTEALTCKAGILAEYYQMDKNLEQLLNGFYGIAQAKHIPFLDQYYNYLNGRADANLLANYYYNTGYILFGKEKQDYNWAVTYLVKYGLKVSPNNINILEAASEIYLAAGNKREGLNYAQRALSINANSPKAKQLFQQASR